MLSTTQIANNRAEIIALLRSTQREGMEQILAYLDRSGFYDAPSSINGHHNWKGGLAEHCLGVCKLALELSVKLPKESVIIAGILHDICKAAKLYYDENNVIHHRTTHVRGHGYRSLWLLEHYGLRLTEEERLTVRWHMGGHHATPSEQEEVRRARNSELWDVIHRADQLDAGGRNRSDNGRI